MDIESEIRADTGVGGNVVREPLLIVAQGRGHVGKTTVLNIIAQWALAHKAAFEVWDGDRQHDAGGIEELLGRVMPVRRVPVVGSSGWSQWFQEQEERFVTDRRDVLFDMPGGDDKLAHYAGQTELVEGFLEEGLRMVLLHVGGGDRGDYDMLQAAVDNGFAPEATVVIVNQKMVEGHPETEFSRIEKYAPVAAVRKRGGQVVMFPFASGMPAIQKTGLGFKEIVDAKERPAGLVHGEVRKIKVFWRREVPEFIRSIPEFWLPAMPEFPW